MIASVGLKEYNSDLKGYNYEIIKMPVRGITGSHYSIEIEGYVKLIVEKDSKRILGVQICDHNASRFINEATLYLENNYTLDDVLESKYDYPSLSDVIKKEYIRLSYE